MWTSILLLLVLIMAMGDGGLIALKQITGLEVIAGYYDFQPDFTMVYVSGESEIGMIWSITVKWVNGNPAWVMFSELGQRL